MISSRWVIVRTCALTRKQSSPVMRWHSTTSGMLPDQLGDLVDLARRGPDTDDCAQRIAERGGVNGGVIATDYALTLQTLESLGDRRRGQTDAPAELRDREAGVGLKLHEQAPVGVVERGRYGNKTIIPLIHRLKRYHA